MPMIEMDEAEYKASRELIGTIGRMMQHPEARKMVLSARKAVDPAAVIPELDAAAPLQAGLAEINKTIAEIREERRKEKEDDARDKATREFSDKWEGKKRALREQGYNTDYVESVEKLAHERGLADFDAAEALFSKLNPPATVGAPGGGTSWDFFSAADAGEEDAFMKKLWDTRGENDGVMNAEIGRVLAETRGQVRR